MTSYEKMRKNAMAFMRATLQQVEKPISMNELCWRTIEKFGIGRKFIEEYIYRLIEIGKVGGEEHELKWIAERDQFNKDTSEDGIMEEFLQ